jgi:hypothetical protein
MNGEITGREVFWGIVGLLALAMLNSKPIRRRKKINPAPSEAPPMVKP